MINKVELIEDWKKATRLWSVRFGLIGTAVMGIFTAWPESALYLWGAMPGEVRALIPERFVSAIALFVFVMSTVSRIIKQRPKHERIKQDPVAEPDAE